MNLHITNIDSKDFDLVMGAVCNALIDIGLNAYVVKNEHGMELEIIEKK